MRVLSAVGAIALAGGIVLGAQAQRPQVSSPRLYVFDCGLIDGGEADMPAAYGLTKVASPPGMFSVPCYLVVHPNGTLLWDLGLGDALAPVAAGGRAEVRVPYWSVRMTLKKQLADIGYTPQDITYVAMSHFHGDHTGNANDYAGSTWLVQKAERDMMFPANAGNRSPATDVYRALKNSKTVLLNGDHDVFGDGTVIIKSTPGHTPGHQSLYVHLAKYGPVVLSGDLYHYAEERTQRTTFNRDFNREQTFASRDELEKFLRQTGAKLWIEHDLVFDRQLKKSPEYYD
jgi:glyoxylase-like metal-dependent hydrolase (beta-lactamase superfamily II)